MSGEDDGYVSIPLKDDLGISASFDTGAIEIEKPDGTRETVLDPFIEEMHVLTIRGPMPIIRELGGMIQKAAADALEQRGAGTKPDPYASFEGLSETEKRYRDGDR